MRLDFPQRSEFDRVLRKRIEEFFSDGSDKTGGAKLAMKTIMLFVAMLASYFVLVFGGWGILGGLAMTFVFVQLKTILAFNAMHDGAHGSFSKNGTVNGIAAALMDLFGSSSFLWRNKHNSLHHTYTNIAGKDDDLDVGTLLRLSPHQKLRPWHKYQAYYAPLLYGMLSLYLIFYSDFKKMLSKRIGDFELRAKLKDWVGFFGGKAFYAFYALALPSLFNDPWGVLACFVFGHAIFGLSLSLTFQLAHTVMETDFPNPGENGEMPYGWMEHQLASTCDFAKGSKLVTFYCGGLNFQVEHHLFHKISHVHYPKISKIVEETCKEFGKRYNAKKSLIGALASHFAFLNALGKA